MTTPQKPAKKAAAKKTTSQPRVPNVTPAPVTEAAGSLTPAGVRPPVEQPTAEPVKYRVEEKRIVAVKTGSLTFFDRVKGWYKGLIVGLGGGLIIVNELTPAFDYLPVQDKHYITTGIAIATIVLNALKSNEKWVESPDV